MFCTKCGTQLKDGTLFCTNCGCDLRSATNSQNSNQPQSNVQPQNNIPQQQVNQAQNNIPQQQVNQAQNLYQGQNVQPNQQYQQPAQQYQQPVQQYQQPVQQYQQPAQQYQQPNQQYQQPNQAQNINQKPKKGKKGLAIGIAGVVCAAAIGVGGYKVLPLLTDKTDTTGTTKEVSVEEEKPEKEVVAAPTSENSTVMVYMIGSNLESEAGYASQDIFEMLNADCPDNVNIVLQTGGCTRWDNPSIKDNVVQRFHVEDESLVELDNLGSVSMVDNSTLSDFISFAADEYPAERYYLILWDHGGGDPVVGFGMDELYPGDLICYNELPGILEDGGVHMNAIITDACNMCTLEVAKSISGYADYLVASEQAMPGTGTYYTGWLSKTNDMTVEETCITIAKEYKKSLDALGRVGCISVIDTSKIDDVNAAYGEFLQSLYETNMGEFIQNRNKCSDDNFDIIDIISMASWYKTSESKALVAAVENSILYYDGDAKSTNGLAVYSPLDTAVAYDDARQALTDINYDEKALEFYDSFCSLLIVASTGKKPNSSWYSSKLIDMYPDLVASEIESEGGSSSGGGSSQSATLTVEDCGGYYFLDLADGSYDVISDRYLDLYVLMDDNTYCYFGSEYSSTVVTDDGDIEIYKPEKWTTIGGMPVPFYALSYQNFDGGEWEEKAVIPAYVNSQFSWLIVYCDDNYPAGQVTGYMYDDDPNYTQYTLNDNDEIQIMIRCIDDGEWYQWMDPMLAKNMTLKYEDFDFGNIKLVYNIETLDGTSYETDVMDFD